MDHDPASQSSRSPKKGNIDQPSLNLHEHRRGTASPEDDRNVSPEGNRSGLEGENRGLSGTRGQIPDQKRDRALLLARDLISTLNQPYVVLDQELRLQVANERFYTAFRLPQEECRNQNLFRLGNGKWDIPSLRTMLQSVLVQRQAVQDLELEHEFPAIGRKVLRLNACPFPSDADRPELILVAIEETSRATDTAPERSEASADELKQLHERKDEFLAMLSHELRNPLAPITSALELLGLQPNESKTQQHARTIIERQVKQLKRVIDDLLEVSRMTTGRIHLEKERSCLNEIIENAVETIRPLLERSEHRFDLVIPPQSIWVEVDPVRLEQVIVNLLSNAAKYTNPGGHVSLSVSTEEEGCVIHVSDTGVGIAPELLPQIFDYFTQADRSLDRSKGGMGIGLSLVKRLVELHGGRVEVSSTVGQGSDFVVMLPLAAPNSQRMPSSGKETKAVSPSALRVLIVDDNEDGAQTLGMLLLRFGYEALTVHDGPTSIEAALDYRPDVILLDLGLPGMNGFEVAKKLRLQPEFKDVLIVAMTGYGHENDRQKSLDAGINHHLIKPSDFGKLQQILDEFVKKLA